MEGTKWEGGNRHVLPQSRQNNTRVWAAPGKEVRKEKPGAKEIKRECKKEGYITSTTQGNPQERGQEFSLKK